MKYHYSPYTNESIKTDTPSDWMLSTDVAPPHDGMFFDGKKWYDPILPTAAEVAATDRAAMQPLSAWQIRKVLIQFGLRDQVEAAIAQAPLTMQDGWHYASQFKRDDDTLLAAAQRLNITDAQLDTMFGVGVNL